jgi:hypothetical protein
LLSASKVARSFCVRKRGVVQLSAEVAASMVATVPSARQARQNKHCCQQRARQQCQGQTHRVCIRQEWLYGWVNFHTASCVHMVC